MNTEIQYEQIVPFTETLKKVVCPTCHEPGSTVNHLIDEPSIRETAWHCNQCGMEILIKVGLGGLYVAPGKQKCDRTLVLLQNDQIALVVEGINFSDQPNDNNEYFYNEHTCPTNYLTRVIDVIDLKEKQTDPHGLFKFVKSIPFVEAPENQYRSYEDVMKLFGVEQNWNSTKILT